MASVDLNGPAGYGSSTLPASMGGPLPAGQTPPPSYGASTVYTDSAGKGYSVSDLANAWNSNTAFKNDPLNARVPDILSQYSTQVGGTSPVPYNAAPTSPTYQVGPGTAAGAGASGTSPYGGTNVYQNNPLYSSLESLINGVAGRLSTPYTAPDYQSTLDYLKNYIGTLSGPAYTPDQLSLYQTQAIDPIMAQRDADNKQIIARFAAQGIPQSSGIVQSALMQNNQKYGAAADSARANLATSAIGTQKAQQQQAATLQATLPGLETSANTYNNNNALSAIQLAQIIPQIASGNINSAAGSSSLTNSIPNLISLLLSSNNMNNQQGAAYSSALAGILPYLIAMYTGGGTA